MNLLLPRKLQYVDAPEKRTVPENTFQYLQAYFWGVSSTDAKKEVGMELVNGRGKIFKRISKYIHEYFEKRDPYYSRLYTDQRLDEFRKEVLDVSVTGMNGVSFCFSDKFDWKAGDFGDSMSCFFTEKTRLMYAREKKLFEHNGVKNIRFYREGEGIGRAWIIPMRYIGVKGRGQVFINFYGVNMKHAKQVLDKHFDCEGQVITLAVDDMGPDLFINNNIALVYTEEKLGSHYELCLNKVPRKKPEKNLVAELLACMK